MKKTKFKLLALFFLIAFSINSWAQKTQVSGKVVDDQNVPLPGANVVESGTKNGVMTDFDGKFKLDVSKPNAVIVVSFMGYADQSIKLSGSKTNLTVKLVCIKGFVSDN